ncbi:MAG: hypothetical protein WA705_23020 [Candidatus Ozemobacteraceae bacterium]
MKKFFLLSLALFTLFSAGCGSSGSDNPAGSSQVSTGLVRTNLKLTVPATDVNPSKRAAYWKDFVLSMNGVLFAPTASETVGANVNLTYDLWIASGTLGTSWSQTSQSISNVTLYQAGTILATFNLPASDLSTSAAVPPTPTAVTITVTKDSITGVITITGSSSGTTITITPKVTNVSQILVVENVQYYLPNFQLVTLTEASTNVPVTPTFVITFNASVSGAIDLDGGTASWNILVNRYKATDSFDVVASYTLDSTNDASLFTVSYSNSPDRRALSVALNAGSSTKKLAAGDKYSVTLNSSSLYRFDVPAGSPTVRLSPITRTFTTAQ